MTNWPVLDMGSYKRANRGQSARRVAGETAVGTGATNSGSRSRPKRDAVQAAHIIAASQGENRLDKAGWRDKMSAILTGDKLDMWNSVKAKRKAE